MGLGDDSTGGCVDASGRSSTEQVEAFPSMTDSPPRVCCPDSSGLERRPVSARSFQCAWRDCQRVVSLCSRCDRGNRYCSPACASMARRASLRAAGLRYQRSRRGRFKHAARQARYRARCRARQKVTHHSPQAPRSLGKLQVFREYTAFTVISSPVTSWHAQALNEFRTGNLHMGEDFEEPPARNLADVSRGARKGREESPPAGRPPACECARCCLSLNAPRTSESSGAPHDTPDGVPGRWPAMIDNHRPLPRCDGP
jgi:hypothetical protein